MGDRSLQVPGYGHFESTFGDSDGGEDELHVIEMTPRRDHKPLRNPTPLFYSTDMVSPGPLYPNSPSSPLCGSSISRPPRQPRSSGARAVAPLNLYNEDGEAGDKRNSHMRSNSRTFDADPSPGPNLTRDPSGNSEQTEIQKKQSGFLGGFMSGLAKALASDESPDTSPDNSPTGDTFQSPISSQPNVPQLHKPLRYGENERLGNVLLFTSPSDTEAKDFSSFLKDDGAAMRIPVLCMSDFGRGDYARDLWVLPHNALKRELFDLYEIVGVIRMRYLALTWSDLYALRQWWRMFKFFWDLYLSVERCFLDPLVQKAMERDGRKEQFQKKISSMGDECEWISLKFEEVTSYLEEFEAIPRGRALSLICKTTDSLGFKILGYFNAQERILPPLIEAYHDDVIKRETEAKVLNLVRSTPLVDESTIHFIRWMEPGKDRDNWINTNLWWGERSTLRRMYRTYSSSHGRAVDMFRKRLGKRT